MARTHGSTAANKLQRRRQLLRYFLRGVTDSEELSRLLHCSVRTTQLDLQALRPWLHRKVEADQLHSLRISFLQKREIWREIMALHHRPLQNGKEAPDIFRKTRCLELAMKMSSEFDRIGGIGQSKPPAVVVRQDVRVMLAAAEKAIEKLSEEEQIVLAKTIRELEHPKASSGA
ncbi:MAG: hypothetical protein ACHQ03_07920 [Candidatus Bathyarchaeia archaeon]